MAQRRQHQTTPSFGQQPPSPPSSSLVIVHNPANTSSVAAMAASAMNHVGPARVDPARVSVVDGRKRLRQAEANVEQLQVQMQSNEMRHTNEVLRLAEDKQRAVMQATATTGA